MTQIEIDETDLIALVQAMFDLGPGHAKAGDLDRLAMKMKTAGVRIRPVSDISHIREPGKRTRLVIRAH